MRHLLQQTGSRTSPKRYTFLLLALILITGCGSTSIYVPIIRPAEINLQGKEKVGVLVYGGFSDTSWQSRLNSTELTEVFLAPFAEDASFELINLSNTLPKRFNIDEAFTTQNSIAAIAKQTSADAFIICEISELTFDEDILEPEVKRFQQQDEKKYVRMGIVQFRLHISVIDAGSKALIWESEQKEQIREETKPYDVEPPPLDPVPLVFNAINKAAFRTLDLTEQIRESVLVTFLNDSRYPAINTAIRSAQKGDWNTTITLFEGLVYVNEGAEDEHMHRYNLGIAYQYSYNFRKAKEQLDRALALKDSPRYAKAIDECLRMERSYLELINQK